MITFFVNLKKQSHEFFETVQFMPQAWLLSSHRATGSSLGIAANVRSENQVMMADNGTIEFIRDSDAMFAEVAKPVSSQYKALRRQLPDGRRTPFTTEIPAVLNLAAVKIFNEINDQVDLAFKSIDPADQTDIQLAMNPSHVIAREDWSIAVGLGLGLERELLGFSSGRYVTRNRQSLRGWQKVSDDSRAEDRIVFVTLAAADYTTACAVGREAAKWGAQNIALGFAGLNSDNTYTDITFSPRRRNLQKPGPRRYARLAEIVTGFRDAYRQSDTTLKRFHALGLGSRPMWNILAAGFDHWTDISTDATSAIKDASGRAPVVYHPDEAQTRVPVRDIAASWLENGSLPFESPILEHGLRSLPGNARLALEILNQAGVTAPTHEMLRSENPLGQALPLFANGEGTALAGRYMVHHNYWASIRSAQTIPLTGRRKWALDQLADLANGEHISITVKNGARVALEVLS